MILWASKKVKRSKDFFNGYCIYVIYIWITVFLFFWVIDTEKKTTCCNFLGLIIRCRRSKGFQVVWCPPSWNHFEHAGSVTSAHSWIGMGNIIMLKCKILVVCDNHRLSTLPYRIWNWCRDLFAQLHAVTSRHTVAHWGRICNVQASLHQKYENIGILFCIQPCPLSSGWKAKLMDFSRFHPFPPPSRNVSTSFFVHFFIHFPPVNLLRWSQFTAWLHQHSHLVFFLPRNGLGDWQFGGGGALIDFASGSSNFFLDVLWFDFLLQASPVINQGTLPWQHSRCCTKAWSNIIRWNSQPPELPERKGIVGGTDGACWVPLGRMDDEVCVVNRMYYMGKQYTDDNPICFHWSTSSRGFYRMPP